MLNIKDFIECLDEAVNKLSKQKLKQFFEDETIFNKWWLNNFEKFNNRQDNFYKKYCYNLVIRRYKNEQNY